MRKRSLLLYASFLLTSCLGDGSSGNDPAETSAIDAETADVDLMQRLDLNRRIEIVARLDAYHEPGMTSHYADGSYSICNLSTFSVLEPPRYSGQRFQVGHHEAQEVGAEWTRVGAEYRILVSEDMLDWIMGAQSCVQPRFFEIVETVN